MRLIIIMLSLVVSITTGCKSKKETTSTAPAVTGGTTGKVSHQYQSTGCPTVIVISNGESPVTIIPKDKLSKEFDVDGLEITFDYRPLKMPQPAGCTVGMPAELTNISKKK
ncbi:MAG: hypothetical protein ACXVPU_06095 [Bacteroidia bacterium]